MPHHLFSEAAREMDLARHMQGRLWYPPFDEKRASIQEIVELFKAGRMYPHAIMNWQSKEQLDMEFILNTPATIIDSRTVEVEGQRFSARNLVLCTGARTRYPDIPGIRAKGVYDFATLIEDLDYEPNRCVIIGGSKVALEYGSFFQATGCQTTILTRSPLMETASLHHVDAGMREYVVAMMADRGIEIIEGAEPIEVLGNGKVTGVRYREPGGAVRRDRHRFRVRRHRGAPRPQHVRAARAGHRRARVRDRGHPHAHLGPGRVRGRRPGRAADGDVQGPQVRGRRGPQHHGRGLRVRLHLLPRLPAHHLRGDLVRPVRGRGPKQKYRNVIKIQMPPDDADPETFALPAAEGSMLYAFTRPVLSGWLKLVIDADSRKVLGAHHVGYGAKDAFQYIDYLIRRPEGFTMDEMAELNELFLNPEHFIQLCRLRAGQLNPVNL